MKLRIELPPGHTVEDRKAAILSTPSNAYVRIGKPPSWFKTYRRNDQRNHGVSALGYYRDGDSADQDIRMTREDEPWAIEVTHLPVEVCTCSSEWLGGADSRVHESSCLMRCTDDLPKLLRDAADVIECLESIVSKFISGSGYWCEDRPEEDGSIGVNYDGGTSFSSEEMEIINNLIERMRS